jgi:hypothetical protein
MHYKALPVPRKYYAYSRCAAMGTQVATVSDFLDPCAREFHFFIAFTRVYVQGNCTEAPMPTDTLPLDPSDPPLLPGKPGQCVLLFGDTDVHGGQEVDLHILESPDDASPFWMHNLHLRKTGDKLKYIFMRADRSFYMTSVVLAGNAQVGPQALRVKDGIQALIAGVHPRLSSSDLCVSLHGTSACHDSRSALGFAVVRLEASPQGCNATCPHRQ